MVRSDDNVLGSWCTHPRRTWNVVFKAARDNMPSECRACAQAAIALYAYLSTNLGERVVRGVRSSSYIVGRPLLDTRTINGPLKFAPVADDELSLKFGGPDFDWSGPALLGKPGAYRIEDAEYGGPAGAVGVAGPREALRMLLTKFPLLWSSGVRKTLGAVGATIAGGAVVWALSRGRSAWTPGDLDIFTSSTRARNRIKRALAKAAEGQGSAVVIEEKHGGFLTHVRHGDTVYEIVYDRAWSADRDTTGYFEAAVASLRGDSSPMRKLYGATAAFDLSLCQVAVTCSCEGWLRMSMTAAAWHALTTLTSADPMNDPSPCMPRYSAMATERIDRGE